MCVLENFVLDLQELLIMTRNCDCNIIRRHSRKLEQLGDISFPLSIKNWYQLLDKHKLQNKDMVNVFDYNLTANEVTLQIEELKAKTKKWPINIEKILIKDNDVYLHIERSSTLLKMVLMEVLNNNEKYGSSTLIQKQLDVCCNADNLESSQMNLSYLRLLEIRSVLLNFLVFTSKTTDKAGDKIILTLNSQNENQNTVLCGPVLNDEGVKDVKTTAEELFNKRTMDMRMMAQHKYGVQVKSNSSWESYFKKLGKASVTIEMLSNKPQKALKISMNDLQTANKGASFIFYNCARMSALFKEFERRVFENIYPSLPDIDEINFSLLNQSEEWELFYIYILQFPVVIKNCIRDIERGIFNPQYLISFLSGLSAVFSIYYRRVRILTDPREHLFAVLQARIYLLRALQRVFHIALWLLNIEPVSEM